MTVSADFRRDDRRRKANTPTGSWQSWFSRRRPSLRCSTAPVSSRGIEAGSWVTIQGSNLANTTRTWRSSDFVGDDLPTSLDGVSVSIDGQPAFVEYISPTQINVQAPSDSMVGAVNVVVDNNGAVSAPATGAIAGRRAGVLPVPGNQLCARFPPARLRAGGNFAHRSSQAGGHSGALGHRLRRDRSAGASGHGGERRARGGDCSHGDGGRSGRSGARHGIDSGNRGALPSDHPTSRQRAHGRGSGPSIGRRRANAGRRDDFRGEIMKRLLLICLLAGMVHAAGTVFSTVLAGGGQDTPPRWRPTPPATRTWLA